MTILIIPEYSNYSSSFMLWLCACCLLLLTSCTCSHINWYIFVLYVILCTFIFFINRVFLDWHNNSQSLFSLVVM